MVKDTPQDDPLQSLIAEILDAESRGELLDREDFVRQHPKHERSLREFFINHDWMKGSGDSEDAKLPPVTPVTEDATLRPASVTYEDATLPSSREQSAGEAKVGDKVRYFGDYELLEEIARGGMGVVYKARQINLNRFVALKMILSGQLASEEDAKRFYTEAEAAANLDHPGIVPIFDVGEHQGQHYFSMGYIEGETLADKVADGPLPPREAAEMVQKICEAMAYAHARGVIHRDLKPANILIDQNDQPKVTDFGLAKRMEADSNLTGTGQIIGTPSYMAPEQASGKVDQVGPLADVYALGGILYCLLAGRPPFQADNPIDTLLQVLNKEPLAPRKLNSKVHVDLETICLKCLAKGSGQRYTDVGGLAEELERFLNGEPILARPVSAIERGFRWCRRNPTRFGLLLSTLALFIAGGVIATVVSRQNRTSRQASALAYQEKLLSAQSEVEKGKYVSALNLLSQTPESQRSVEYEIIEQQVTRTLRQIALPRVSIHSRIEPEMLTRDRNALWRSHDDLVLASSEDGTVVQHIRILELQQAAKLESEPGFMAACQRADGQLLIAARQTDKSPSIQNLAVSICLLVSEASNEQNELAFRRIGSVSLGTELILGSRSQVTGGIRHTGTMNDYDTRTLTLWDVDTGEVVFDRNIKSKTDGSFSRYAVNAIGSHLVLLHETKEALAAGAFRVLEANLEIVSLASGKSSWLALDSGSGSYRKLALSDDGSVFAGETTGGNVEVWDVNSGDRRVVLESVDLAFDTKILFSPSQEAIAFSGKRGAGIANLKTNEPVKYLSEHRAIEFVGDNQLLCRFNLNTCSIWNIEAGKDRTWKHPRTATSWSAPTVNSLSFSRDGNRLLSVNVGGSVRIWDLANDAAEIRAFDGLQNSRCALSPDGRVAAFAVRSNYGVLVRLANVDDGSVICEFGPYKHANVVGIPKSDRIIYVLQEQNGDDVKSEVVVSDWNGNRLTGLSRDYILSCDMLSGELLAAVQVSSSSSEEPALGGFSYVHKLCAYDLSDSNLLWSESEKIRGMVPFLPPVVISGDGTLIVTHIEIVDLSSFDTNDPTSRAKVIANRITAIDSRSGRVRSRFEIEAKVRSLAISPDLQRVVIGSNDGKVHFYDLDTGQQMYASRISEAIPTALRFSPSGQTLMVADRDGNISAVAIETAR